MVSSPSYTRGTLCEHSTSEDVDMEDLFKFPFKNVDILFYNVNKLIMKLFTDHVCYWSFLALAPFIFVLLRLIVSWYT